MIHIHTLKEAYDVLYFLYAWAKGTPTPPRAALVRVEAALDYLAKLIGEEES